VTDDRPDDGGTGPAGVTVRTADPDATGAAVAVLERALLDCPPATVREAAARGDCLIAVDRRPVGACVLEPRVEAGALHVVAVAVRRRHRGRGIGRALLERAAERGRLTATFRPAVRGFYEACGFRIYPLGNAAADSGADGAGSRLYGVREP